jgi:hypothetical protein
VAALAGVMAFPTLPLAAQSSPTIDQFLRPGLPLEIISAKKVDRIAWIATERGQRNVYTAVAPAFVPVPLTKFRKDDGVPVTQLSISDDGSIVTLCAVVIRTTAGGSPMPTAIPAARADHLGGAPTGRRGAS